MTEEPGVKKIIKPTLSAVFQSQERIRQHLDEMIKNNRPIKDDKERNLFIKTLTFSTLGIGSKYEMVYEIPDPDNPNRLYTNGIKSDLQTFARWLTYQEKNMVYVPNQINRTYSFFKYDKNRLIPISKLWQFLRDSLFTIFPIAQERASSQSREQEATSKTKGYKFERVKQENG